MDLLVKHVSFRQTLEPYVTALTREGGGGVFQSRGIATLDR